MQDSRRLALRQATLLLDGLTLVASTSVAFALHTALQSRVPWLKGVPEPRVYTTALYLFIPVWVALDTALGQNRAFERRGSAFGSLVELTKLHGLGFLLVAGMIFLTHSVINRAIIVLALGVNFALMLALRLAGSALVEVQWKRGLSRESVLLVGDDVATMRDYIAGASAEEFAPQVVGVLTHGTEFGGSRVLGPPELLPEVLRAEQVDQVMFFGPFHRPDQAKALIEPCERAGIRTAFSIGGVGPYPLAPQVLGSGGMPFLTFDWVATRPGALVVKHAFDAVAALVGLVLLSPLLLGVALAVWATMGRPVLFSQVRVGLNGRRFRLLKFRTMVADAEKRRNELLGQNEMVGPVFKMTEDPRVTRLGGVLRRWSLDELPQLVNVVRGEMSLVGPRPLPVIEQQEIQGWHRRRLAMKPGITGLWQVSGRSAVAFDDWMKMDLRYVENWALRLDLELLVRTVPAVLRRRGAH